MAAGVTGLCDFGQKETSGISVSRLWSKVKGQWHHRRPTRERGLQSEETIADDPQPLLLHETQKIPPEIAGGEERGEEKGRGRKLR